MGSGNRTHTYIGRLFTIAGFAVCGRVRSVQLAKADLKHFSENVLVPSGAVSLVTDISNFIFRAFFERVFFYYQKT